MNYFQLDYSSFRKVILRHWFVDNGHTHTTTHSHISHSDVQPPAPSSIHSILRLDISNLILTGPDTHPAPSPLQSSSSAPFSKTVRGLDFAFAVQYVSIRILVSLLHS